MKIIVTGSRGFIGSVLCKVLQQQGHEVYGVDMDGNPNGSTIYGLFTEANINEHSVALMAKTLQVDAIFHLAASADVGLSMSSPELFYLNNVGNTAHLLANLKSVGWTGKFIFSSTAAVYRVSPGKVHETSTIGSPNAYGRSKYACEHLLYDYHVANGIDVVVFRYFNVAGAYTDTGDHVNASHIISRLCNAAYHNLYFPLYGDNKHTRDGTCVRDYLHVLDVCNAHIHAAAYLDIHPGYHTFNLGTGVGTSNREMIAAFKRFTGKGVQVNVLDGRPGDPDHLVAGADKFTESTGFRYEYSSLENIITCAWEYYNNLMMR